MSRAPISLCMIVKNEEKFLEKCLKSIQNVVEDIIIVDTGSTDRTIEIAEKYNAKIFYFKWIDDFSAARNYSIEQATSDYILVLDADEYLDDNANLIKEIESSMDYYVVNIKNYKSTGRVFTHQAVRLFKKSSGLRYFGKLHEHLNIQDRNLSYANASFIIHHDGYREDVVVEKNKKERNRKIMMMELEQNPTSYSYYNMGNSYMSNGQYEKAIQMYQKSFELDKNKTYRYSLLCNWIECLRILNRYEDAITIAKGAIQSFPFYTDFYFELGRIYEEIGYLRDAEKLFKICLEKGEVSVENVSFTKDGVGNYLSLYHLSKVLLSQGRYSEAFDSAYSAVQKNKHFQPAVSILLEIMLKVNINHEEVFEYLTKVYRITNIEDLKTLILVLYKLRHPLLNKFLSLNPKADISNAIKAIAKQYSGAYQEALMIWNQIEKIDTDMIYDALILAIVLKNTRFIDKYRDSYNISNKEWKQIRAIVGREDKKSIKITPLLEQYLIKTVEGLIVLNEFEIVEEIAQYILVGSIETKIKFAKLLHNYGFSDVSLDLLYSELEKYQINCDLLQLLGDILVSKNKLSEALTYYLRLKKINKEYSTYERLYIVYEKLGDLKSLNELKNEMMLRYSKTMWIAS